MTGVTPHGLRYPDGASKAKNLGPELQTFAEDIDEFIFEKAGPIAEEIVRQEVAEQLGDSEELTELLEPIVGPAVEAYIDEHVDVVTAAETAERELAIIDENSVPVVTVKDIRNRPYLAGSSPIDVVRVPGDDIEIIDEHGVVIANLAGGGSSGPTFDQTWVIPLCGQSNAVALLASPIAPLTNEPLPNLFMVQAGAIVPAVDPLPHARGSAGAGTRGFAVEFARNLARKHPNVRIVLVPVAVSGTGLYYTGGNGTVYTWAPDMEGQPGGGISLYREAIERTNAVVAAFPDAIVPVILWHQMESDAVGGISAAQYMGDATHGLLGLIAGFRAEMNGADADTIFLAGQTAWEFRNVRQPGTYAQIDAALAAMPNAHRRTGFALAPGAGYCNTDNTHFTGHGQWLLAMAYVLAYEAALYNL